MNPFTAEFLGTFFLILLGSGVVANVNLKQTAGHNSGWIVITLAWGLAVFTGVIIASPYSGAHLNPAVSVGLALAGAFDWSEVLPYIVAQFGGAALGAATVWAIYKDHFDATQCSAAKLSVFSTAPAISNTPRNLFTEAVGTFVLIFTILFMVAPSVELEGATPIKVGLGSLGALPVALLVVVIGLSLGGTTGYAINPARDFAPRCVHALLPIANKGSSQWHYAWIPIVGPLLGAAFAAVLFHGLSL
jgi:glycerol uptake facilitator protein